MELKQIVSKLEALKHRGEWEFSDTLGTEVIVRYGWQEDVDNADYSYSVTHGEWVVLVGGEPVDEIDVKNINEVAAYIKNLLS